MTPLIRRAESSDRAFIVDGFKNLMTHIQTRTQDAYFMDLDENYDQGIARWIYRSYLHDSVGRADIWRSDS